jgi:hypothetical protein
VYCRYRAKKTAQRLNRDGKLPPRGKRGWCGSSIRKILTSETVLGIFQPCNRLDWKRVREGDPIPDYYPQIIPKTMFLEAQRVLRSRRRLPRGPKGTSERSEVANLFTGLGLCKGCEGGLYFNNDKRYENSSVLTCARSHRKLCKNKPRLPYNALERTVLLLHDLTAAIADLIPNSTDDMTTRHIAELVAAVELNRQSIRRLMTKFSKHPIAAVHDTAEAEIEALGSEIERMERELDELRCGVQMIEHKDQKNLLTRFREAKILMRSDDENERFLARSKIAQELRRVIEALVLHEDRNDRRVTVQIKLGSEGRIDYELTPRDRANLCSASAAYRHVSRHSSGALATPRFAW